MCPTAVGKGHNAHRQTDFCCDKVSCVQRFHLTEAHGVVLRLKKSKTRTLQLPVIQVTKTWPLTVARSPEGTSEPGQRDEDPSMAKTRSI